MEMDPRDGFQVANWESGFGDYEMKPDPASLKILAWQPEYALVICDYLHHNGKEVEEAPRSVLQHQLDALKNAHAP